MLYPFVVIPTPRPPITGDDFRVPVAFRQVFDEGLSREKDVVTSGASLRHPLIRLHLPGGKNSLGVVAGVDVTLKRWIGRECLDTVRAQQRG